MQVETLLPSSCLPYQYNGKLFDKPHPQRNGCGGLQSATDAFNGGRVSVTQAADGNRQVHMLANSSILHMQSCAIACGHHVGCWREPSPAASSCLFTPVFAPAGQPTSSPDTPTRAAGGYGSM